MNTRRFYVYVHLRATTKEPFYYGKGCDKRALESDRNTWHANVVRKHGFVSVILKDQLTEKEAYSEEKKFIAEARARGENIVNVSEGGEGFTSETARLAGKKGGATNAKNKTGVCGRSKEKMSTDGRKAGSVGGARNRELGTGICGLSREERSIAGKLMVINKIGIHAPGMIGKGAIALMAQHKGIFSYDKSQLSANGKVCGSIGGKISSSKKVKCVTCGLIAHAGPIAMHQKGTGHSGVIKL